MAPFYGCRDPGTKLDGVKLAPVTAKTSKTGPRHVAIISRISYPLCPAPNSYRWRSVFSRDDVKVASAAAVRRAQLKEKGAIPTKTRRDPVKMGRLT